MIEIRFHGRFGQPFGEVAKKIANYAVENGKEVQFFNAFAAIRPGAPNFAVVRVDDQPILERSTPQVKPDMVVVMDNSLFTAANVYQGLKDGGIVMAYGVDDEVLGENKGKYKFKALDPFFADNPEDVAGNLVKALKEEGVLS